MFIDDYLSKSQIGTLIVTGVGAAVFFPSYFGVSRIVHRNTCDSMNRACGTRLPYRACEQFKSEFINGGPIVNTNGLTSAVRSVGNLFIHPITTIVSSMKNILSFLGTLRDFSGAAYVFGISHEIGLFVGSTAAEFDMAFLAEDAGFNFWGSVGIFVPCGQVLTILWRMKYYNQIGEQMRHFHNPAPNGDVCRKVREFQKQHQREFHQEKITEPQLEPVVQPVPAPQYYYDGARRQFRERPDDMSSDFYDPRARYVTLTDEPDTDVEYSYDIDTRPLAVIGVAGVFYAAIKYIRSLSTRSPGPVAVGAGLLAFIVPEIAQARPSEDDCESWVRPELRNYCSKPGMFMSRDEILPNVRDELMPWELLIRDYHAE